MNANQRRAALIAALEKFAKKEGQRDRLDPGAARVKFSVEADVDGHKMGLVTTGQLSIAVNQTKTVSQKPDMTQLAAYLLGFIPKARRKQLLPKANTLPEAPAEDQAEAENLVLVLTSRSPQEARGAVAYCYEIIAEE